MVLNIVLRVDYSFLRMNSAVAAQWQAHVRTRERGGACELAACVCTGRVVSVRARAFNAPRT